MLGEDLPPTTELEDALQNGVYLCRIGMALLPKDEMWKKVYDLDQSKFKVCVCTPHGGGGRRDGREMVGREGGSGERGCEWRGGKSDRGMDKGGGGEREE